MPSKLGTAALALLLLGAGGTSPEERVFRPLSLNLCTEACAEENKKAEGEATGLSLEECLALALENHPSLRKAKGGTRGAAASLEQIRAQNRMTLSLTGSASYKGDYEEWSDRAHSETVSLTASKLLYDTGRNRLSQESRREALLGEQENERQVQVTVAANAKRAYYDLVLKILNRDVEQEKLKNLQEHLEKARGLYEVGNSPFIDVTKAESDAAGAQVSLLKAENDILVSREALKVAMGTDPGGALDLALPTKLLLPRPAEGVEALLAAALEDRPDYRQLLHTLRARELDIKNAARNDSPTLKGTLGSDLSKREGSSATTNYSVGLNLTIPIADGGATAAGVESARAQRDQTSADLEALRQKVSYGVRSAALSLSNAIERVRSAGASVQYAEENLDLARGRYEVGVGTALELSDAVSQLASSRYTYYQALYDAQTARADLDEAMGHLPPEIEGSDHHAGN
ncbi:MAG: TolC family protein [Fretibacterium sp.]|nr:TolC family protein [Fretibacterium sp.]